MQRALLSVSDKTNITELARRLHEHGVELLSTGGTYRAIQDAGVPVTEVAAYTGFPEMMDGRVKTLHPKIHGGILGRRSLDQAVMAEHGIEGIDLVVVNLYPFAATISQPGCTESDAIENIDIGGPAMVRSAAKNHQDVLVVVDPSDYSEVLDALSAGRADLEMRRRFAVKAFRHTAQYDATIAQYLGANEPFPDSLTLSFQRIQDMRYGENPHQRAAFYRDVIPQQTSGNVAHLKQHQGKALSYNNIADADAALQCVAAFDATACVIVKHANPCGVGIADSVADAYDKAFATDPTSAFGGIIALNRTLDGDVLQSILDRQFVEVVVAPEVTDAAIDVARAKKNVRLLSCGNLGATTEQQVKRVGGGVLVQDADAQLVGTDGLVVKTKRAPTEQELADLDFAWRVAWFVKSNAIVYARDGQTIGVGAGQMSRVISAKIAELKAAEEGLEVSGSVMASDAFFPFRDSIDAAAQAGITAIVQPGGSIRDDEVIQAADEHGMAMVFTGTRHFRH